jgi:hypothetical protein
MVSGIMLMIICASLLFSKRIKSLESITLPWFFW